MRYAVQSGPLVEITEQEIDSAIAACNGDPRETIRALLVGQTGLGVGNGLAGFGCRHADSRRSATDPIPDIGAPKNLPES